MMSGFPWVLIFLVLVRLSANGIQATGAGMGYCGQLPGILEHDGKGSGRICLTWGRRTLALKRLGCLAWWLFWQDFGIVGEFGQREKAEELLPDSGFLTTDFMNKPNSPGKQQHRVTSRSYSLCCREKARSHREYGWREVCILLKCPFCSKICSEEIAMC